jgi:hypothetical protein
MEELVISKTDRKETGDGDDVVKEAIVDVVMMDTFDRDTCYSYMKHLAWLCESAKVISSYSRRIQHVPSGCKPPHPLCLLSRTAPNLQIRN